MDHVDAQADVQQAMREPSGEQPLEEAHDDSSQQNSPRASAQDDSSQQNSPRASESDSSSSSSSTSSPIRKLHESRAVIQAVREGLFLLREPVAESCLDCAREVDRFQGLLTKALE